MSMFDLHSPDPPLILVMSGVKKAARVKQKPKVVESITTDKEHVNIVFIGHVGKDSTWSQDQQ